MVGMVLTYVHPEELYSSDDAAAPGLVVMGGGDKVFERRTERGGACRFNSTCQRRVLIGSRRLLGRTNENACSTTPAQRSELYVTSKYFGLS